MTPAANSWVMDAPPPRLHRTILASSENVILHSGRAAGEQPGRALAGAGPGRRPVDWRTVTDAWDAYLSAEIRIDLPGGAIRVFPAPRCKPPARSRTRPGGPSRC